MVRWAFRVCAGTSTEPPTGGTIPSQNFVGGVPPEHRGAKTGMAVFRGVVFESRHRMVVTLRACRPRIPCRSWQVHGPAAFPPPLMAHGAWPTACNHVPLPPPGSLRRIRWSGTFWPKSAGRAQEMLVRYPWGGVSMSELRDFRPPKRELLDLLPLNLNSSCGPGCCSIVVRGSPQKLEFELGCLRQGDHTLHATPP
jgi:hypothetical protein